MKTSIALLASLLSICTSCAFGAERLHAKVTGHGAPMILIPGLNCSGEVWDETAAHFADRFECHVLTLAGFAGTEPIPGDFIVPSRDAVADYIKSKHLKNPVVVGHSLGGYITMDLAATYPELTGPVVVVDAYPFFPAVMQPGITEEQARANAVMVKEQILAGPEEDYRNQIRAGTFTRIMVTKDSDFARVTQWGLASDRASSAQAMTEMLSVDLRARLAQVKDPMQVMVSYIAYAPYVDHARSEANARSQYSAVKNLRIDVSDTARHFIMYDDAAWFYSRIDTFLAGVQ